MVTSSGIIQVVKEKIALVSVFFFLYVVTYIFSKPLGMGHALKTAGGIIYLPAGARLLACLVGRAWGALGVFIATWLIVGPDVFQDQSDFFYFMAAFVNSASVFVSVVLALKFFKISDELSNLNLIHLPFIDLLATTVQATCYYFFLTSVGYIDFSEAPQKFASQVTGNFLGGMIFMFALMLTLHFTKRKS
jgi:hypothetical protein